MAGGGQRGLHRGGKDTRGECSMSVAGAFSAVEEGRNLNEKWEAVARDA